MRQPMAGGLRKGRGRAGKESEAACDGCCTTLLRGRAQARSGRSECLSDQIRRTGERAPFQETFAIETVSELLKDSTDGNGLNAGHG